MAAQKKRKPRPRQEQPGPAASDARGAADLSARPLWEGHLRLSLVSCPIALYSATSRASEISFHLLNPKTNNRIRMVPTDPDIGPVERRELVKGYEIDKNRYVVITQDELNAVKLETTRALDIERFVDARTIDRLFWNDPFFILPAEHSGIEAYTVIRDAMAESERIALGRLVMHTREHLMAVEPRSGGLIAYSLRMRDEVVDPRIVFRDIPQQKPNRKMIDIAEKIIEQQDGDFAPEQFQDRYESALRDLIAQKERGEKPVAAAPPKGDNVVDLMDALKRSLKAKTPPAAGRRRSAR